LQALWLIPAIPFASALLLAVFGSRFARRVVAIVGSASIAASSIVSILVAWAFLGSKQPAYTQVLWSWIEIDGFHPQIALYLDALSLVMVLVVTFVAFWIHLYSTEFMAEDDGYSRFFAYMNLFVASMVLLLLANNLLVLYAGWEGVGLCSYLLIGFWYRDPANGYAARKAFLVTRIGDTSLIIGLFILFTKLGTLEIQELMHSVSTNWAPGSTLPVLAAFLILGGAVGKSAQLPLQVWLPDAMAGPTPTSALIHAATMVAAGVYLIARTHVLFQTAPQAQAAVAIIGAATLLASGFSALTQHDLKRVLAYSTISQIGYMFLALGVGFWSAAIFHFLTHAFFKALLFLCAGAVIGAVHEEHDIFRMGGLRKELPVVFWTFLIGGCSLAGFPVITAGAYSKDFIIWGALASKTGGPALWFAAAAGVFLTTLYTFRLIFLVFFGESHTPVTRKPGLAMTVPLVLLGFFAIFAGALKTPLISYLSQALPSPTVNDASYLSETASEVAIGLIFAVTLGLAYLLFLRRRDFLATLSEPSLILHQLWYADWGFDWLYDKLFVRPVLWLARVDKSDFVDLIYAALARLCQIFARDLSKTESGRVRWYTAGIAGGTAVFVAIVLLSWR
jgi:NADH-quinone oxidoreductase subunit L